MKPYGPDLWEIEDYDGVRRLYPVGRELVAKLVAGIEKLDKELDAKAKERDAAVAEAAALRAALDLLCRATRLSEQHAFPEELQPGLVDECIRAEDALSTPGPGAALLERLARAEVDARGWQEARRVEEDRYHEAIARAEKAEAACRAAWPHHQGGHSRVGALLREVVGEKPNLVDLDVVKSMQAAIERMRDAEAEVERLRAESETEQGFTNSCIKRLHAAERQRDDARAALDEARARVNGLVNVACDAAGCFPASEPDAESAIRRAILDGRAKDRAALDEALGLLRTTHVPDRASWNKRARALLRKHTPTGEEGGR